MQNSLRSILLLAGLCSLSALVVPGVLNAEKASDYKALPPFLSAEAPPLVMMVMDKSHKLYYEAYNDATDLNEDGTLDTGYRGESEQCTDTDGDGLCNAAEPFVDANGNGSYDSGEMFTDSNKNGNRDAAEVYTDTNGDGRWNKGIDYYGYFDSYKCYAYTSAGTAGSDGRFNPTSAPIDANGRPIKKCSGANEWSGDFLNYLTMSRMDALRKVLYGGSRSVDTASSTLLRRVFIPQDAHSWGKEYQSVANDGYDIQDYTPLSQPAAGTRHLFATTNPGDEDFDPAYDGNTTKDPLYTTPLLRVLPNNTHRIWEWVAKERPVADHDSMASGGTNYTGYPADHQEYIDLVARFANAAHLRGSQPVANINGVGNPFGPNEYYLDVFSGTLTITTAGLYEFAVDGDDAVELLIDGVLVAGWYGGHGSCNCTTHSGTINLSAGPHQVEFRHQEATGSDNYYLRWKGPDSTGQNWEIVPAASFSGLTQTFYDVATSASTVTDYVIQVEVCNPAFLESNCKQYPSGNYKPIGLLQRYGETNRMNFGLITGSYDNNISGGILRKNIRPISDEIVANTGQLVTTPKGVIGTIEALRPYGFQYSNFEYKNELSGSAWVTTRPMLDKEFPNWGNPVGEMMYEALRYFAGKVSPTADYIKNGHTIDDGLGLPRPSWINPYVLEDTDRDNVIDPGEDLNTNGCLDGFENCAKPFILVLSDIYPTYDSDQLPGSYFNSFTGDLTYKDLSNNTQPLNVSQLASSISSQEGIGGLHYIGQEQSSYDNACTPKNVTDLGLIRGLCPEEPTKLGSYYAASVAYFGMQHDISTAATNAQQVATYAVGMASPLPKIEINAGGRKVTLVPFAKSVGGSSISAAQGAFQPTNQIVDFFVQTITPTYGKFRINYEDVEQGADHDMDAIVEYEYVVNGNGTITVNLKSTYAAGGIIQHMGYIISGTTNDGVYLEVRDFDTAAGSDPDYFLDTPPGINPGGAGWSDSTALPLQASRTFTPSGASGTATLLENPLWYAAKWGGFIDKNTATEDANQNGVLDTGEDLNGNNAIDFLTPPIPDRADEWDTDGDGVPDNYFYVVNALKLEEQLTKSFAAMLSRASSGTAASVISNSRSGEGAVYQSIFYPTRESNMGELTWVGEVHALFVDSYGNLREDSDGDGTLDEHIELDTNSNGTLDSNEDTNKNGRLDTTRDQIIVFTDAGVYKYDDVNENGAVDTEDTVVFSPDIPKWHNNGKFDTEDANGDSIFQREDLNCDGILNQPLNEDVNHNGILDLGEDLNGNSQLDFVLNEDANHNGKLDSGEDLNSDSRLNLPYDENVLGYDLNGNSVVDAVVWEDANGDNIMQHEDINCNGVLDREVDIDGDGKISVTEPSTGPFALEDIKYVWAATDWLNQNTGVNAIDPLSQRIYTSTARQRYIFTFVDTNQDMIPNSGEVVDFVCENPPPVAKLTDSSTLYPYLNLFETFADEPTLVASLRPSPLFDTFLQTQTKRQINYIRGEEQPALSMGSYTLPAMRNRSYETGNKVWRLGDIVHSTPTVVSSPAEGYHLLYRDSSYAEFAERYQKRRTVIYVGANDGMVHAFNGGYFDGASNSFITSITEPHDWNGNGILDATTSYALGSELWAYVPHNLLPHLYWLTKQDYPHVYYVDLKPKIFDAKIFVDASGMAIDADHPGGWGTVMAIGMQFGGGQIHADMNKKDGNTIIGGTDRTMRSALILFDITNPEKPPRLLAELSLEGQGYTTCFPAVVPMRSKTGRGASASFNTNDWYLVYGSGPADASGNPSISNPLISGVSEQAGKMYMVDLKALVVNSEVRAVNKTGTLTTITAKATNPALTWYLEDYEANSFISAPVSVDYDLDFNADAVYFGTVSGNKTIGWGGKVRRLIFEDDPDYLHWHDSIGTSGITRAENVLIDLSSFHQPITAPLTIALDDKKTRNGDRERWLFFGTGRFYVRDDAPNADLQRYYGIKEPSDNTGFTWEEVMFNDLLDVSNAQVYDDRAVKFVVGTNPINDWASLVNEIDFHRSGWYLDLPLPRERNLGSAALLGELLTFTTYQPSQDICNIEGNSYLRALYYKTGTAYYQPTIGYYWDDSRGTRTGELEYGERKMMTTVSLGQGMAVTPNIHTGQGDGSEAFVQTSTGAIRGIKQVNPGMSKSGKSGWKERR